MVLAEWQVGQLVWTMLWFTLFIVWMWMFVAAFTSIFRSPDLGGWAKALWVLLILAFPILGVVVYVIARGDRMAAYAASARPRPRVMVADPTAQAMMGRVG